MDIVSIVSIFEYILKHSTMNTQNATQITAYVRCIMPGNGVELDKVYPTSGMVLSKAAVICYYLVDLETPVPAAQFTIDAVVTNK